MKITFVCGSPAKGKGGSLKAAENIIRAMRSRGHEVAAVCFDKENKIDDECVVLSGYGQTAERGEAEGESLARWVNGSLELMVADSDAVFIFGVTPACRAALGCAVRHKIPVAAAFCAGVTGAPSRALAGNVRLANLTVYRMMYNSFYSLADAVLYPTLSCRAMMEKAVRCETNGFVLPAQDDERPDGGVFCGEESADIFEDMLYSIR